MITTSQSTTKLVDALSYFHKEVGKIKKDATNPFFSSKYAPLPAILDAIEKPLADAGIVFVQFPSGPYGLTTRIIFGDEWMEAEMEMKPTKDDPQGRGSCITYMRRYALGAILGLNIDEDDDGNTASTPQKPQVASHVDLNNWDFPMQAKVEKMESGLNKCEKCGADLVKSPKTGKIFCVDKCWLKK